MPWLCTWKLSFSFFFLLKDLHSRSNLSSCCLRKTPFRYLWAGKHRREEESIQNLHKSFTSKILSTLVLGTVAAHLLFRMQSHSNTCLVALAESACHGVSDLVLCRPARIPGIRLPSTPRSGVFGLLFQYVNKNWQWQWPNATPSLNNVSTVTNIKCILE